MNYVQFGNTGLSVSRLCIGTGTHGWGHRSQQTALGIDGLASLLTHGYDLGVNFWDAADQYGSHPHVAEAMKRVGRDNVVVATKTTAKRGGQIRRDIERFLKELETDILDIVLLHSVSSANWPKRYESAMAALAEAQEKGYVRAVGFSCHSLGALRTAVNTDWPEVILVRINHAGVNMDGQPNEVVPVIEQLHGQGKAIYGMKVLGCGQLHDVERALRWVLDLGTVHALSIGTSSDRELEENVAIMERVAPSRGVQG
ncbi:MAG: aldo/keto reductase [Anaerolineae bacterium]